MRTDDDEKVVATNRKARFEYTIEDRYEAGIVLTGTEIKSIRAGAVSLGEGYVTLRNHEVWLVDVHIAVYEQAGRSSHEPTRQRKLLLHRREITKLERATQQSGHTIVPLRMYMTGPHAKVEIGLASGKRQLDKRQKMQQDQQKRDAERSLKNYKR